MAGNKKQIRITIFWTMIFIIQMLFFQFLPRFPKLLQTFNVFFEKQKYVHIAIFSRQNFPWGDIFYLLLGMGLIIWLMLQCKKWSWRRMNLFLLSLIIFSLLYQIFWGIRYQHPPIDKDIYLQKFSDREIKSVAEKIIFSANTLRQQISEEEFHNPPEGIIKKSAHSILHQQKKNLPPSEQYNISIPHVKTSLYTPILSYLGVWGYYNPFTAEANINRNLPSVALPFTAAHEMAHQMGVAREGEASFIGYLYATQSNDAFLAYSAYLQAISYVVAMIKDEKIREEIKQNIHPKVLKDMNTKRQFSQQYAGQLNTFFSQLNDWFLKSNQQEGIISYSTVGNYIVGYELLHTNK